MAVPWLAVGESIRFGGSKVEGSSRQRGGISPWWVFVVVVVVVFFLQKNG